MASPFDSLQTLRLPDEWQMKAIGFLKEGKDVIVQAPTGSGKTYIFEQYFEQSNLGRQAIYTVPTRALANDKYAEWKKLGWKVGITTGDLVIDPEAPVVVATLEAQQAQRQAAIFVIDEYQMLGDISRGHHYEGVILGLPLTTQLLLLSGSVANPPAVQKWLQRMGRKVEIVKTENRPVPLEEMEIDRASRSIPDYITGFWIRRLAAAIQDNLSPVLVFAPHRRDAMKLARQAASIPCSQPLELSKEQIELAGPDLLPLLRQRVAYHHSGLTYAQRAGLIEPLAKAGQLRIVVATLGLAAGINFSLRSVLITSTQYAVRGIPVELTPSELLQMFGRAGRRGLDEVGYVLVTRESARLGQGRPGNLVRSRSLPWSPILRKINRTPASTKNTMEILDLYHRGLFSEEPIRLGCESTQKLELPLPCGLLTDTGRARLVRRKSKKFAGCKTCPHRPECFRLSPMPTLAWMWVRLGLLDKNLTLTQRGVIMSQFLSTEGLGVVAALEDGTYGMEDLVNDLGNLAAGERFCGYEPRWSGKMAMACQKTYRDNSWDGFLEDGMPINYGYGARDIIHTLRQGRSVTPQMLPENANRGDVDRLWLEWKSLLRQIAMGEELQWERWQEIQKIARKELDLHDEVTNLNFPPLTALQQRPMEHRL
ncbi:MAG: DEAD/DEAH box helicase [Verrucomicrobiota bacterium]